MLNCDVLDLVSCVEEINNAGPVAYVQMNEVVEMIVSVQDKRVRVVRPKINKDVLNEHALQQQFLLVLAGAEIILLQKCAG